MADEFDRASDLEESERQDAIARALARPVESRRVALACAHCEELPRQSGSVNCKRCAAELMQ
jgi:uncharacterized paraquat-inducible protein A